MVWASFMNFVTIVNWFVRRKQTQTAWWSPPPVSSFLFINDLQWLIIKTHAFKVSSACVFREHENETKWEIQWNMLLAVTKPFLGIIFQDSHTTRKIKGLKVLDSSVLFYFDFYSLLNPGSILRPCRFYSSILIGFWQSLQLYEVYVPTRTLLTENIPL